MKKFISLTAVVSLLLSCGPGDRGEVLGGVKGKLWKTERPYGMSLVPGGSTTIGKASEDFLNAQDAPARSVTIGSFYMDETEVTNNQYRKFVEWVKDSIVRTRLAVFAEEVGMTAGSGGIGDYAFLEEIDPENQTPYEKYMFDNYYSADMDDDIYAGRKINKRAKIPTNPLKYPDEYFVEVMDSLYLPASESFNGIRTFDTSKLVFKYSQMDIDAAVRDNVTNVRERRSKYIKSETVLVYPDTTRWLREFQYSYNEPMHNDYFWHEAYGEYPVVGVNWYQAKAFCAWRTLYKNDYLKSRRQSHWVPEYRLPNEAEWEYSARGGLESAMYPWGGPYTTDEKACFLANFKPTRTDYAADGALYTAEVRSYPPNGYNLYNMSGNVAEWTSSSYDPSSYDFVSSLKPKNIGGTNPLKVVRGGSWRDPAYFLQVSTRDSEFADSARSYIGFRTAQTYSGPNVDGSRKAATKNNLWK